MSNKECLKVEDLDFAGKIFGATLEKTFRDGRPDYRIDLYLEDDEVYHPVTSFHPYWLSDLKDLITKIERANKIEARTNWGIKC